MNPHLLVYRWLEHLYKQISQKKSKGVLGEEYKNIFALGAMFGQHYRNTL